MLIINKKEQELGKEYVYFAKFVGGFVKIGVSRNPKNRLKQIVQRNQVPLEDYFLVEGYFDLEKTLHTIFKKQRRYSEFFELSYNELYNFIRNYHYTNPSRKKNKNKLNIFHGNLKFYSTIDYSIQLEKIFNLIASSILLYELKFDYINSNFYLLKEDYLQLFKELESEDYKEEKEYIDSIKTKSDFYFEYMINFDYNYDLFINFMENIFSYKELIMHLKSELSLVLEKSKTNKESSFFIYTYPKYEKVESDIAAILEFTKVKNDKEVYHEIKNYLNNKYKKQLV